MSEKIENTEIKNQNTEGSSEANNIQKADNAENAPKAPKHAKAEAGNMPNDSENQQNKKRAGIIGAIVAIIVVIVVIVCVFSFSQNKDAKNTQVTNNNENIAGTEVPTRSIEIPEAFFDDMTGGEAITYLFTGGCSNIKARPKGGYMADITYDGYDKLLSEKREGIQNMLDNPEEKLGCASFTSCKYDDSFENIKITTSSTQLQKNEQDAILKIAKQVHRLTLLPCKKLPMHYKNAILR